MTRLQSSSIGHDPPVIIEVPSRRLITARVHACFVIITDLPLVNRLVAIADGHELASKNLSAALSQVARHISVDGGSGGI